MSRLDHPLDPKGETVQRIEVIAGGGERRRRWSDDERAEAVEESLQPGLVVSQVARELYGILGDSMNQAADFFSDATSMPSRNVTPLTTFGN